MQDKFLNKNILINFEKDTFHLNWFGKAEDEGRTEDPTQKKLDKARQDGDVPKSMELNSSFMILLSFYLLYLLMPYIYDNCIYITRTFLSNELNIRNFTEQTFVDLLRFLIIFILKVIWPILIAAFLLGIIISVAQVGFLFSTKQLKFDISKIKFSPKKAMEKMLFSKQVFFNLLKSVFKVTVLTLVAYLVLKKYYSQILELLNLGNPFKGIVLIGQISMEIVLKSSLLLIIFAFVDFWFQKKEYKEKLKMTKQEVKDEFKQMEGDPLLKSKMREKQRELARQRMMEEIPNADVVITNPTHFAVALKYDLDTDDAPNVVAKGQGYLALKIIGIAKENNVPVVQNKPLARTIYFNTEVGDDIPVELYRAVAEILAYVWKLKGKQVNF